MDIFELRQEYNEYHKEEYGRFLDDRESLAILFFLLWIKDKSCYALITAE